ncbi:ImmA/IrrE family metallo-endopeptidase [Priestia megaterium]|uniref:ImmA/IrrE family metallo-endopeptidase n=1 Tax=Priestia megaterium TaxID=1404 RepID=UPI001FB23DB8|nr:ImmA/IrrE family metallo-endopeptidase [Priestia megaterium]
MTTKMMMMISKKPNFGKAEQAAFELLKINNVQELPVKVKKLAKNFSNLKIKTYSWFAKTHDMTLEEVCEFANSDEGCCWYIKSKNKYIILYNDKVENVGRIRWTIAHELGHFMLKHNEMSDKSVYARNSLTEEEYEVFEKEANCFARNLLAPPQIVYVLRPQSPHVVSDLFDISLEAATNVFTFLNNGLQRGISYSRNHTILRIFESFIFKYKHAKTCNNCSYYFVGKDTHYCPICGDQSFTKGEVDNMIYSKIELNEHSRAIQCPHCTNEHIVGDYCQVCGKYLVNKCSGYSIEQLHGQMQEPWHNLSNSCGEELSGDARFCHKCGSTSTFLESGTLTQWEEEKFPEREGQRHLQAVGSNNFVNISDDDLPF